MTRANSPAPTLARGLGVVGLACLALISLASPGATRMFAWPWTLAFAGALLAPALALVLRAFDRARPLVLPSPGWSVTAAGCAVVVIASALASPYRGPSALWSASWLAGIAAFFVLVDWLHGAGEPGRRDHLTRAILLAAALIAAVSLGLWAAHPSGTGRWLDARNPFPLGHSNYTAGLALLMLPVGVAAAVQRRGWWRTLALTVVTLALAMLFTSGSRGSLLGLATLLGAGLWQAPINPRRKVLLAAVGLIGVVAISLAHPRIRASLLGGADIHLVAGSEVQRSAMLSAGWRMGSARPLLGWGPGTTPLVYPGFRGGLAGGAENVLQLHSLPVHLWAELGAGGLAGLIALAGLVLRHATRDATAAITLLGYGAFALTDWQLDIPLFALALATFTARLATPNYCHPLDDKFAPRSRWMAAWVGALALGGVAVVVLVGRPDPTPELNVRALALGRDPAQADRAIALLRNSLDLNPNQEIAHFNLGWLLLVRDPAAAEKHFRAAAHLVPDKGGVYFGLGLARLNQGQADAAARAFALECLNDPQFLASPWWREPKIAATREASAVAFAALLRQVAAVAPPPDLSADQLGRIPAGPERVYRRQRTGYPVLMRNLDLAAPQDLYDVRESAVRPTHPLPPKGWLPSPLLLKLLDDPVSAKP